MKYNVNVDEFGVVCLCQVAHGTQLLSNSTLLKSKFV